MRKQIILLLLGLLSAMCVSARNMYVVSIGISHYKYANDLLNAEKDAQNIATLYKTHTNYVYTLIGSEATHNRIVSTINRVFSKAQKDDIVVLFFSGHGDKNGLCAYDSRSASTLVSYSEIQHSMRNCMANTKQLFIDACFAGGLRTDKGASTKSDHTMLTNNEGVMLFLSSRSNEKSAENLWGNSGFFTQYLIAGLKGAADTNKDKIITAKEIFNYVSTNVSQRTGKRQNPVMWGKFSNNMHIMNWNAAK